MPESIQIKSNIQDYGVSFSPDFTQELARDIAGDAGAVLIDAKVYDLYKDRLEAVLGDFPTLRIEATERNKGLAYVENVVDFLMRSGFKKSKALIAIGGGIIQDLTCFTASTLFRGIDWIFYPTTLLAQCDSCIGSKSSINVGPYKNQLGTFYPPRHIVIDVGFTRTLDPRDVVSGLGEAIKVHYLDDQLRNEAIFQKYDGYADPAVLEEIIYDSLLIKKDVIEKDEYDRDYRNIMNYGHTFGHAIESASNYGLPHGVAVSVGMGLANSLSRELDLLSQGDYEKMDGLIRKNVGDTKIASFDYQAFWSAMARDKKNVDSRVTFILTRGFGQMFKNRLELDDPLKGSIRNYLESYVSLVETK